jgi:glycoprotein-N-acetylgalactosamine 3-beta-galactosyltransferase
MLLPSTQKNNIVKKAQVNISGKSWMIVYITISLIYVYHLLSRHPARFENDLLNLTQEINSLQVDSIAPKYIHDERQDDQQEYVPLPPLNETIRDSLPHPHAGARFANGSLGYIASPTQLRYTIMQMNNTYFDRISQYQSRFRLGSFSASIPLTPDHICNVGPGRSFESDGGFKLLTEKVVVSDPSPQRPRIFCGIYTYRLMRDLARMQALTWGYQCDGFLAFSTETIPELGIVEIIHMGEESYQNMWQKVRSIWAYISDHYLEDYDWFHLGGDDLYMIVNNMRRFLRNVEKRKKDPNEPIFLGSIVHEGSKDFAYVAGGPGYTLNRAALRLFAKKALNQCLKTQVVSHEDRFMSRCFWELGIRPGDTRDYETGEPQYHDCGPDHLYTFRTDYSSSFHSKLAKRWENQSHPSKPNQVVGPKHGLDAAAKYSITFHDIYNPMYVARLHIILFPELCPATSAMGRALRFYGILP